MRTKRQRIEHLVDNAYRKKYTTRERLDFFKREVKRRLIKDGIIADPANRPKKYQYHWTVGDRDQGGIVEADTAGEARGLIKKQIGIKGKKGKRRLPECIKIVRIPNDATTSPGDLPFEIRPVPPGSDLSNPGNPS